MKPRRLLLSVDLLPTINEMHEDLSQTRHPGHSAQSLEEYVASIKELSQPAAFSSCAPLRVSRSPRPRLASFPHPRLSAPPAQPHVIPGACKPCLPAALDSITLTFAADAKRGAASRDPLDWLFAQTECGDLSLAGNTTAALCLL
ncbi:protein DEPP-like [Conger conger]|uniref:protein DEPP-like n=1 Tax=Conger conger TaxID=82655 RepID=UPI002A5AB0CD|nr:protein DEPP-like [Conger conger]